MTARDPRRGQDALDALRRHSPGARVTLAALDLADLGSIRSFAADVTGPIDLLINNAGVMAVPKAVTADGFELQFGTNHLGHFALTGLLLDTLLAAAAPRVVTLSSTAAYIGKIAFDDLDGDRRYTPLQAYGQSKLANLLFTVELARRARAAGLALTAVAAHPGYAHTNLQSTSAKARGATLEHRLESALAVVLAQSAEGGALPTLYAATDPEVRNGGFYGPRTIFLLRGGAGPSPIPRAARDRAAAARLWQASVELTGVDFARLTPGTEPDPA